MPIAITGMTVKTAIIKAISAEYPDMEIYTSKVEQDAIFPYFLILQLDFRQTQRKRENYYKKYFFNVSYHLDTTADTQETPYMLMGEELTRILDLLEIDGGEEKNIPIRTRDLRYMVRDEVLQFFFTVEIDAFRAERKDPNIEEMGELEFNIEEKENNE